ncbi:MAG: hypothetical protein ACM3X7_04890 [Solirubrobacterales bacterium]
MDRISQTAIKAACYRAYHWNCDEPKILTILLQCSLWGKLRILFYKIKHRRIKNSSSRICSFFKDEVEQHI